MEIRKLFRREEKTKAVASVDEQSPVTGRHALSQIPVAFQGEPGAYSFEVARSYFKSQVRLCPYPTFAAVCEAVVTEQALYGVLPIANSQTGRMVEMERLVRLNPLAVIATVDYPINHCLLCLPGQQLSDIVIVISHPQALEQCSNFLKSLQVQIAPTENTAASAKMIRDKQLKGFAAVASASAAEYYQLEVLASAIQNTR